MATTVTSRELNQNPSRARKAAKTGPVFITSRGEITHVLMNIDEYRAESGEKQNIFEMVAMPEDAGM